MGPAAYLHAEGGIIPGAGMGAIGHADDPDNVAVTVAEKGESALTHRFGVSGLAGGHKQVVPDLLVGEGLDREQLIRVTGR